MYFPLASVFRVRFSPPVWCVFPPMSGYYDYLSLFSHFTILAACICHWYYVESTHLRHFWCIRMIIPPVSSLSSSTDELRQGAKQLSRGVEQYYLSTEVSLLVSVWFGWRARGCDELGMQWIEVVIVEKIKAIKQSAATLETAMVEGIALSDGQRPGSLPSLVDSTCAREKACMHSQWMYVFLA